MGFSLPTPITFLLLLLLQHIPLSVAIPGRRDTWFCEGNAASWDQNLWNDVGMKEWFHHRSAFYVIDGWPTDPAGVPRAIAEFGGFEGEKHDEMYNWGTACISVDATCDLSEEALKTNPGCEDNSHRAFVLWAMRNSARFVQNYYAAITDIFDTSSLAIADLINSFIYQQKYETVMGQAAEIMIMGGVISTVTSLIPGVSAGLGGTAIGNSMSIATGILKTAVETPIDPRFTTFGDMAAEMGQLKLQTQNTISAYFDGLYRNSPPQGDVDAGCQLDNLLASGAWAEQDMAELPFSKGEMIRQIHAGIITEMWNSQTVMLVKWTNGLLDDIHGTLINPCWVDPGWTDAGIDPYVACVNDRNFMMARMNGGEGGPWSAMGWDVPNLSRYGLTQKLIIDASEHRQAISGNWIDRTFDVLRDDLASFAQNPPDNLGDATLAFNLPICDLDALGDALEWDDGDCFGVPQVCLSSIIKKSCPKLLLNDAPFPYTP